MEIKIIQYLIICPLVFLAGLVDAVAGGGGLISLPAYMIAGLPTHFAIGTNKMSSSMGCSISVTRYALAGYINWKRAVWCIISALIGSSCGASITLLIEDRVFKIIMLFIIPLTAFYVMKSKTLSNDKEPYSPLVTTFLCVFVAFVTGMYDGFYGPGAGTFMILLLTGLARLPLNSSNGIAKAINFSSNVSALTVFLINDKVLLPLGITAGLFSIAGNFIGTKLFEKGSAKFVRPFMITVLVIFFIKVITELFF